MNNHAKTKLTSGLHTQSNDPLYHHVHICRIKDISCKYQIQNYTHGVQTEAVIPRIFIYYKNEEIGGQSYSNRNYCLDLNKN